MDDNQREQIVAALRKHIASENISRDTFALKCRLSRSAIDKALTGNFTEKTIDKIEINTGIRFRDAALIDRISAPEFGAYLYSEVKKYEGQFLLIRRDFDEPHIINAFDVWIEWDSSLKALVLSHLHGPTGFVQKGTVSFSAKMPYLSIHSRGGAGWEELSILSIMADERAMYGGILTIGQISKLARMPVFSALVILGYSGERQASRHVYPDDPSYDDFAKRLETAKTHGVRLIQ